MTPVLLELCIDELKLNNFREHGNHRVPKLALSKTFENFDKRRLPAKVGNHTPPGRKKNKARRCGFSILI